MGLQEAPAALGPLLADRLGAEKRVRIPFNPRERWLSAREFGEAWALSQLSPGIHLVALAGLIGRRAAGWRGALNAPYSRCERRAKPIIL